MRGTSRCNTREQAIVDFTECSRTYTFIHLALVVTTGIHAPRKKQYAPSM